MNLVQRALAIGLRALADEVDAGRLDATAVMGAVAPVAPFTEPPAAPEPERPRPQRRARPPKRAQRAAPAPAAADIDEGEPAAESSEAGRLVAELVATHGDLARVAERFGFQPAVLGRWRRGNCSPAGLERLRAAAAGHAGTGGSAGG